MIQISNKKVLAMVKDDGCNLKKMDISLKKFQVCLEAVKQNGLALQYVPDELKTLEMCLEAVKQNKNALQYVPNNLKDRVKKELNISNGRKP